MRHKYKKFLKAAYINYEEDYCGYGSSTFTKPTITTPIIVITGTTAIIACEVSGVTIYYTLDGSTPTSSSTEYTGTITLTLSCTIKAIAVKPGMTDSEVASESYIHYLTAWRLVGNSEVHTDPYLTQWKVEGNSVVDNNAILSCGDLGQDGKYHVKISNGVTIYDIPLTEPLRKVNDIADSIEFANGVATLTRAFGSVNMGDKPWGVSATNVAGKYRCITSSLSTVIKVPESNARIANILTVSYDTTTLGNILNITEGIGVSVEGVISVYDENYNQSDSADAFKTAMNGVELIYELATPTTELIEVSPFPISPTDTYTSANDTPYSAFEYKKNVEIWSCGEYNATDGKYHILVQPLGGSIADIALDEPLRKVNDVADSIEFANGTAVVTRACKKLDWVQCSINRSTTSSGYKYFAIGAGDMRYQTMNILSSLYPVYNINTSVALFNGLGIGCGGAESNIILRTVNSEMESYTTEEFRAANANVDIIYELATPTTETIQVPQIEETDSYTCVISQGGKAVEWSSFETE